MEETKPIRVLMAKIGLDGHDRGVRVVSRALRDAGLEVIYTGPWQTPEQVAEGALQEDVDIIGISSLAYDHVLVPKLIRLLEEKGLDNVPVVVGGIVPDEDAQMLEKSGVAKVFHPGANLEEIINYMKSVARKH